MGEAVDWCSFLCVARQSLKKYRTTANPTCLYLTWYLTYITQNEWLYMHSLHSLSPFIGVCFYFLFYFGLNVVVVFFLSWCWSVTIKHCVYCCLLSNWIPVGFFFSLSLSLSLSFSENYLYKLLHSTGQQDTTDTLYGNTETFFPLILNYGLFQRFFFSIYFFIAWQTSLVFTLPERGRCGECYHTALVVMVQCSYLSNSNSVANVTYGVLSSS